MNGFETNLHMMVLQIVATILQTFLCKIEYVCSRVIIGKQSSYSCVLIVVAVRRVVASSSLTQSLKGIATAGIVIVIYA